MERGEHLKAAVGRARDAVGRDDWERQALSALAEMLPAVAGALPLGIVLCDSRGRILLCNATALDMLGGSAPDTIFERKRFSLLHVNGSPVAVHELPLSRAIERGEVTKAQELLIRRTDGGDTVTLVSSAPLQDPSGRILGAIAVLQEITKRRQNEMADARLAAIVESTDDAVIGAKLDGTVKAWNRGAERLYGYTAAEILGQSASLLIPEDRVDEFDAIIADAKRGPRVDNLETVRRRKDGTRVDVSLTISPIKDPDGQISGISWIAHDVTERRRIEQAALASEERFRSIYQEAPIGIELYDADGHLIDANQACLNLFGVSDVADVIGFDLFADPNVSQEVKEKLRSGETVRYGAHFDLDKARTRYKTERRGELYLDVLITPLGLKEGKPLSGYLVHVQDITERVQAGRALDSARAELETRVAQRTAELAQSNSQLRSEIAERKRLVNELREKNDQLTAATARWQEQAEMARRRADEREAIIAAIADGVFICDREGRIVDVNQAGLKLMGVAEDEFLGKLLIDFLVLLQIRRPGGKLMGPEELALSHALRGITISGWEEVARNPRTQEEMSLLVSSAPIYDDSGNIAGAVEVISDITRIKEYDRLKDQFIAMAAHELKTPVAIMKGYAQALLRAGENISDPQRRMLDAINRGSDKIDRVVKDLLDVSRLHLGRMELAAESIDLPALVEEVVDRTTLVLPKHRLRIVHADPVVVQGDKDRLEQVLANLIDNAAKYSPRGGDIEIEISMREDHDAVVAVRDCGIGIPYEKQANVFERFYRAHTGTPHDYGGMGVGLYISKEIIERQGGRMWFESKPGKGSVFYFSLPLRKP